MPAVLDFRSRAERHGKPGRPQRNRLLLLALLVGLSLILINTRQDVAVWRWFDRLASPQGTSAGNQGIDNRLASEKQLPGTFVVPADHGKKGTKGDSPIFADTKIGTAPAYPFGVTAADLASIRDDTPSTRDEQAISLRLLDIAHRTDPRTFRKASLGPVTYAQLFRQPDAYRGRIVSIAGVVRRVSPIDLPKTSTAFRRYYQAWLWPTDNPSSPVVVYCLELPQDFPTGMEIAEQAEVTGFFFKRWAYQAGDGLRTAPEILARSLQWQRRPSIAAEPAASWTIPLALAASALLAIFVAWLIYVRTKPTQLLLPVQPPDFGAIEAIAPGEAPADDGTQAGGDADGH